MTTIDPTPQDQATIVEQIKVIGEQMVVTRDDHGRAAHTVPTLLASRDDFTGAIQAAHPSEGGSANASLVGAVMTLHQTLAAHPAGTMVGTLAGLGSWPEDWDRAGTADPIPAEVLATLSGSTIDDLVPMVPAGLRAEAFAAAAEVNAITENMRAVLERAQDVAGRSLAVSDELMAVFKASGLDDHLAVRAGDSVSQFFDIITGRDAIGSALATLADLAAID